VSRRTVLLTGATGFVGGALAVELLQRGWEVVALVRAASEVTARQRVRLSLTPLLGDGAKAAAASIRVLPGDLTDSRTLERAEFDQVTHVVHAAACTSFSARRDVWRVNLEGTERLGRRLLANGGLRRLVHVSTAYCCGDRPRRVVMEDDSPQPEHGHVNDYTRSKASAELALRAMNWGDRLLVARPSIVVGHSALGVGPSSSLFWYYRALAALCRGPHTLDARRDVVPVDYVARALSFLLQLEQPAHSTYHVSAGADASSPLGEILERLTVAGALHSWRQVVAAELGEVTPDLMALVRTAEEARRLARGLSACARFGELAVQWFDNTRLLGEGFRAPPAFIDYLGICLRTTGSSSIYQQMVDDA
jgi:nucleoside-diphosphate-sugar epimerase